MKTIKTLELNEELETMLICAERYACGRESYMPSLVIDYITPLLPSLTDRTLNVMDADMRRNDEMDSRTEGLEIVEGHRHGVFGDDNIDKPGWMKFWAAIKAEKERRKNAL